MVSFSKAFSVAAFCEKNTSSFLEKFYFRELMILSLDFSCSSRNSIWSCSREIILSVLLLGSCEWDLVFCLSMLMCNRTLRGCIHVSIPAPLQMEHASTMGVNTNWKSLWMFIFMDLKKLLTDSSPVPYFYTPNLFQGV